MPEIVQIASILSYSSNPWAEKAPVSTPYNRALLLKLVSRLTASFSPGSLWEKQKSQAPPQTYWIRVHILTKHPGDSRTHQYFRGAALGYFFGAWALFLVINLILLGFLLSMETMDHACWIQIVPKTRCSLSVTS